MDDDIVVPATFPNLEYLEFEAHYKDDHGKAAELTVARFLQWCPAIRELRLKLWVTDEEGRVHPWIRRERHIIHETRSTMNSFAQDVLVNIDVDLTDMTKS
uniref:Uncharacterized protein n=1 Tax=Leersia perrieri TaxID=77586 RepID=A0A0D9X6R3_9ORYZ